jgi:hypothetical protein
MGHSSSEVTEIYAHLAAYGSDINKGNTGDKGQHFKLEDNFPSRCPAGPMPNWESLAALRQGFPWVPLFSSSGSGSQAKSAANRELT